STACARPTRSPRRRARRPRSPKGGAIAGGPFASSAPYVVRPDDSARRSAAEGELRTLAGASGLLRLEAVADDRAPLLQIAVGQRLHRIVDAEAGLEPAHVELPRLRVETELGRDALTVRVGEVHGDLGDLREDVEIRSEGRDGAVEEHHVLDEEHELLRHAGADAEQRLDRALDLAHELVPGHR